MHGSETEGLSRSHLHGGGAGAHHACAGGMHLGQVVEGQDVAGLRGQVEEFERLLVVALHADAIWNSSRKMLTVGLKDEAAITQHNTEP